MMFIYVLSTVIGIVTILGGSDSCPQNINGLTSLLFFECERISLIDFFFFPAIFNDEFALSALTVLKKKKDKHKKCRDFNRQERRRQITR